MAALLGGITVMGKRIHSSVWILFTARGIFLSQNPTSKGIDTWDSTIALNYSTSIYEIRLILSIKNALAVITGANLHV